MHPLGLLSLVQAWAPEHAVVKLAIALPGIALLILLYSCVKPDEEDQVAPSLPLSGISTIWPFFQARFDFLTRGFRLTGPIYQFSLLQVRPRHSFPVIIFGLYSLLQNTVIAVSGEPGRKDFFSCKGLDINEGFKVLSGAVSNSL